MDTQCRIPIDNKHIGQSAHITSLNDICLYTVHLKKTQTVHQKLVATMHKTHLIFTLSDNVYCLRARDDCPAPQKVGAAPPRENGQNPRCAAWQSNCAVDSDIRI